MDMSVRWMRREDMRRVVSIRRRCGMDPDLLDRMLHDSFSICKVVESEGKILGFIAYRNGRRKMKLLEIAVHPSFRRKGLALFLLRSMSAKTNFDMKGVEASVSEYNLPAQMLLKKAGFLAVETVASSSGSSYKFVLAGGREFNADSSAQSPKVVEN